MSEERMDEELVEVITITDEDGVEQEYMILETITYKEEDYDVLVAVEDEDEEETEVIILKKLSESGDDVEYDVVEDEETLDAVFDIFKELYVDEDEE